jgi:hypothetical protein
LRLGLPLQAFLLYPPKLTVGLVAAPPRWGLLDLAARILE